MESSRRRGPATFQYFSLLYFPFILHSIQVQTRMFHQELLQLSQKRRSQRSHLRLISLIILLSVFHLNTKYKAKPKVVTLCDWLAPEGSALVYILPPDSRKHYTVQLAQVVLAQALYIYRPAGTSGTSYRRRLLAPPCRPDFPRRRAPEQLSWNILGGPRIVALINLLDHCSDWSVLPFTLAWTLPPLSN